MSFSPSFPSGPDVRIFPYFEASPSAALDAVQTSVLLYLWMIVPFLYFAFGLFLFFYVLCLPFPPLRQRMRAIMSKLSIKDVLTSIHSLEKWTLSTNWSACFYTIFLGTPLVAILCTGYGHHPLSFSAYDSPFQSLISLYGFLYVLIPYFNLLYPLSGYSVSSILFSIPLFLFTLWFWSFLLVLYVAILWKGIHSVLRWHMLSIGIFTVLQPFIFRFIRRIILSGMGFSPGTAPDFEAGISYVIAFFLPCLLYAIGGMILHRHYQKILPPWFMGMHIGLFYLAVLAADLH